MWLSIVLVDVLQSYVDVACAVDYDVVRGVFIKRAGASGFDRVGKLVRGRSNHQTDAWESSTQDSRSLQHRCWVGSERVKLRAKALKSEQGLGCSRASFT